MATNCEDKCHKFVVVLEFYFRSVCVTDVYEGASRTDATVTLKDVRAKFF